MSYLSTVSPLPQILINNMDTLFYLRICLLLSSAVAMQQVDQCLLK